MAKSVNPKRIIEKIAGMTPAQYSVWYPEKLTSSEGTKSATDVLVTRLAQEKVRRERTRPRKPKSLTLARYQEVLARSSSRVIRSQKGRAALLDVHRDTLRRFERDYRDEIAAIGTKIGKNAPIE
jgi:hypothetical protein